jgi:hypothetical protein
VDGVIMPQMIADTPEQPDTAPKPKWKRDRIGKNLAERESFL